MQCCCSHANEKSLNKFLRLLMFDSVLTLRPVLKEVFAPHRMLKDPRNVPKPKLSTMRF